MKFNGILKWKLILALIARKNEKIKTQYEILTTETPLFSW